MKNIFFVLSMFVSVTSFAAIDGDWSGSVHWTFQGQGTDCETHLKFAENESSFVQYPGSFDCGIVTMDTSDQTIQKSNGKLVDGAEVLGNYTDNSFDWTERYSEKVTVRTTILIDGNHMDYHEQWIEDGGKLLYNIQGRLFR